MTGEIYIMKKIYCILSIAFIFAVLPAKIVMAKTGELSAPVSSVADCAQFLFPINAPQGTVCRIGSGQKLYMQSDVEVSQSELGPWLLCSVCGSPHNPFGFEGPIYIKTTWGGSFTLDTPVVPTPATAVPVVQSVTGEKSKLTLPGNWQILFWVSVIIFFIGFVFFVLRKYGRKNKKYTAPTPTFVSL